MIGQYGILPAFIRHCKYLTDKAKLTYADISSVVGTDNVTIINSKQIIKNLAGIYECHERSIMRYIQELEENNFIRKVRRDEETYIEIPSKIIKLQAKKLVRKLEDFDKKTLSSAERIIAAYSRLFKVKIQVIPIIVELIEERTVRYTEDQILQALENASMVGETNDFYKQKRELLSIHSLLKNDVTVGKWLVTITNEDSKIDIKTFNMD